MKKRLLVVLVVALVAGLAPVAATAKPKPTPPIGPCNIVNGRLQDYSGGDYFCTWRPELPSTWRITVTPHAVASQVAFTVEDNHPGELCGPKPTQGGILTTPMSGVFTLTTGDCGAPGDPDGYPPDQDRAEFYLWVSATVRKGNTVEVTVERTG